MIANNISNVFVSYRRTNVDFAKQLVEALNQRDKEVWVDWEDIPPGSETFTDDIRRGLEGADAFICILTPDYLESTYCVDMELGYALELKKKIIPIVLQEFDDTAIPPAISHINWIYFIPHAGSENTFNEAFPRVVDALDQDYEHAREHRRLALRAIDWEDNDHKESFLLVGDELEKAEEWMVQAVGKVPELTELHISYIHQSRATVKKNRRQRRILAGVVGVIVALTITSIVLGLLADEQRREAETQAQIAERNEAVAIQAQQEAQIQARLAQENALTATFAQGDAIVQADIALTQVAVAATAQFDAIVQADIALTQAALAEMAQEEALNQAILAATQAQIAEENALTATVAQGEALLAATGEAIAQQTAAFVQEANANSTQAAIVAVAATDVNEALATSESNALTATIAQGEAELQFNIAATQAAIATLAQGRALIAADLAETQAQVAENNAATATVAQGQALIEASTAEAAEQLAEERRAEAQAQALIVRAEQARLFGDANVALALALQAAALNPNLLQTQTVLNQAAAVSPRLSIANINQSELRPNSTQLMIQSIGSPTALSLWDITNQLVIYQIQIDFPIEDFVFSLDGQFVITASIEGGVAVWNADDGTLIAQAQDQSVNRILMHPDNTRFVSAGMDGVMVIRNILTAETVSELRNTTDVPYNQMHFNTDGRWLYAWTLEPPFVLSIWNVESGGLPRRSVENYVLVSSDGAYRVTRDEGQFVIRNMDGDGIVTTLDGDVETVYTFTPDNSQLLIQGQGGRFGNDPRLALIDRSTGNIALRYRTIPTVRIAGGIQTGEFLNNGQTLLAVLPNNDIVISDSQTGEVIQRIGISSIPITLEGVSDNHVVVYTETDTALIFDRAGLATSLITNTREKNAAIEKIKASFLIDGGLYGELYDLDWELTSVSGTYRLSTFDGFRLVLTDTTLNIQTGLIPNRFDGEDSSIRVFSSNEQYVVLGWRDGNLRVWDIATDTVLWDRQYRGTATDLEEIIFLPDNQQFIAFYAETAVLWDIAERSAIREFAISSRVSPLSRHLIANNGNVHSWMFFERHNRVLNDGMIVTRFLFDENESTIYLMQWDIATGEVVAELDLSEGISIADYVGTRFSPSGQTYVRIGRQDDSIEMFNTMTGIRIRRFIGHGERPVGVAFSSTGERLVSASEDGEIILWDVQTGQLVRTLVSGSPLNGIAVSLNLVVAPDNSVVGFTRDNTPIPSASLEALRVETLRDVVAWVIQNRSIRELSCAEREQYSVLPLCDGGVETATPTATLPPIVEQTSTPTATPILTPTATPVARGVIRADSNINLRTGPGVGFSAIQSVAPDTIVIIANPEPDGLWLEIQLLDGTVGWVLDGVVAR